MMELISKQTTLDDISHMNGVHRNCNYVKGFNDAVLRACEVVQAIQPIDRDELKEGVRAELEAERLIKQLGEEIDSPDAVNRPRHYSTGQFECIDVMLETQGVESVMNFCLCNAFKYIYRHRRKNGKEDVQKAKWYLDKYLELEEKHG